jgi:hypothetical protein
LVLPLEQPDASEPLARFPHGLGIDVQRFGYVRVAELVVTVRQAAGDVVGDPDVQLGQRPGVRVLAEPLAPYEMAAVFKD